MNPKIQYDLYTFRKGPAGENHSRFPLCIDNMDTVKVGNIFKTDERTRPEFIITEKTELHHRGGGIIICKRIDSREPIRIEDFHKGAQLIILVVFFEEFRLPEETSNIGNTIEEIFEYARNE